MSITPLPDLGNVPPLDGPKFDTQAHETAKRTALADPAIQQFLSTIPYQQAREAIPGMLMPDGSFASTLEQCVEGWKALEPSFRRMNGDALGKQSKPKSAEWSAKLDLWSQQRQQREAEKEAREVERKLRKEERAALAVEVDAARQEWKAAVQRRKDLLLELDEEIRVLHDTFAEKKRQLEQL